MSLIYEIKPRDSISMLHMMLLERVNIIMLLEKLDVMSVSHFYHFLNVMYLLLFNHWLTDAIFMLDLFGFMVNKHPLDYVLAFDHH